MHHLSDINKQMITLKLKVVHKIPCNVFVSCFQFFFYFKLSNFFVNWFFVVFIEFDVVLLLLVTNFTDKMPDSAGPSGNFLHKPVRGWLHPDQLIVKKGVTYAVRVSISPLNLHHLGNTHNHVNLSVQYVGCLDVNTSMKSLDFDSRFQIAKWVNLIWYM